MNLELFFSLLDKVDNEKRAQIHLNKYLSSFGFTAYAFTLYSGHTKTGRKLKYNCVSEALKPWHQHYLGQGYADVDRTLENNYTSVLPSFWDIQNQISIAKKNREKRIRAESIEFGIDKGLSIPIHGLNSDYGELTLHQLRNQTCLENYKKKQYEWLAATHIYYSFIIKILQLDKKEKPAFLLTKREEQCLSFVLKSWRVERIAKEIGVSESTVNFHIKNANKKLGVNNKYHAAHKYFNS